MADIEIFEKFVKDVGYRLYREANPSGIRVTIVRPDIIPPINNLGLILDSKEYHFTDQGKLAGF